MRIALLLLTFTAAVSAAVDTDTVNAETTVKYLLSCQKPNGAFGPASQEYADLAWTYPAVHALVVLGEEVPRPGDCLENGLWAAFRQSAGSASSPRWPTGMPTAMSPRGGTAWRSSGFSTLQKATNSLTFFALSARAARSASFVTRAQLPASFTTARGRR